MTGGDRPLERRGAVASPAERTFDERRVWVEAVESAYYDYRDVWEELRDPDRRVVKGGEIPLKPKGKDLAEGSQHWGKSYVRPWMGLTQSLSMHTAVLAPEGKSHKHSHQNEALMYILEGEGYEIHDGKEYKWSAGDLVSIHGGCVHQHYSADPEKPCRGLIVKSSAMYWLLHLIYMAQVEGPPAVPAKFADWVPPEHHTVEESDEQYAAGDG